VYHILKAKTSGSGKLHKKRECYEIWGAFREDVPSEEYIAIKCPEKTSIAV